MTDQKRLRAKRPPIVEGHPDPSWSELMRTRDILEQDGFTTQANEYERRARVAKRIEEQIDDTCNHVRDIERISAQAHHDFPDEVSYDEHIAGIDHSIERGEHIVGWLLEHGWTPPSGFAFATPDAQAGVKAYSRDGHEIGQALAAVFGPHLEPRDLSRITRADSSAASSSAVPDQDEAEPSSVPTCGLCQRERTLQDPNDYNPIQVLTGQPVGWYSGDDGEVCPQCMTETLGSQGV